METIILVLALGLLAGIISRLQYERPVHVPVKTDGSEPAKRRVIS